MLSKIILTILGIFFLIQRCAHFSPASQGFTQLFDGQTFTGWKVPAGDNGHWRILNGIIDYDGRSEAPDDKNLWTEREYGNFILIVDWCFTGPVRETLVPIVLPDGSEAKNKDGTPQQVKIKNAGDSGLYLRGNSKSQVNIWCWPSGSGEVYGYRTDMALSAEVRRAVTPRKNADHPPGYWNTFIIQLVNDRLTVDLNGERVIQKAQLPGIPARGAIALQHHGDPIQFRNIWIKELAR